MSGHDNTAGKPGLLKEMYNKNKALGEKANAFEFNMTVEGYDSWSVLCRSTQLPAMGRSDVEDYGPFGLLFVQHGALENSGEITTTLAETISGHVLRDLRKIIKNKEYVNITVALTPESNNNKPGTDQSVKMLDCKIRCDAIDLSTEDTATIVKPSLTIRYNFVDL